MAQMTAGQGMRNAIAAGVKKKEEKQKKIDAQKDYELRAAKAQFSKGFNYNKPLEDKASSTPISKPMSLVTSANTAPTQGRGMQLQTESPSRGRGTTKLEPTSRLMSANDKLTGEGGRNVLAGGGGQQNYPTQIGNLDVTFDSSVSPEARKRFMQDPLRPTAQIARGPRPTGLGGSNGADGYMRMTGAPQGGMSSRMPNFTGGWKSQMAQKVAWIQGEKDIEKQRIANNSPMYLARARSFNAEADEAPLNRKIKKKTFDILGQDISMLSEIDNDIDETSAIYDAIAAGQKKG